MMSNVTLLPRLRQIAVDHLLEEYGNEPSLTSSLDFVSKSPEAMSYAPSGGSPLRKESLAEIRRLLVGAAEKGGFPEIGSTKGRAQFDTDVTILLGEHPLFVPPEALRDDIWAFLTTVVAPDIVKWRFGTSSRERYHGGVRNAFQRLWMRAWSLDRGEKADNRWGLIDELTEDAFVQIVERPSIGGDPRIARALGEGWVRMAERTGRGAMEAIMRRAVVAFRLRNQIQVLAALNDAELVQAVDDAFERARVSLNVEAVGNTAAPINVVKNQPEETPSGTSASEKSSATSNSDRRAFSRLRSIIGKKRTLSVGNDQTASRERDIGSTVSSLDNSQTPLESEVFGTVHGSESIGNGASGVGNPQETSVSEPAADRLIDRLDEVLGKVAPGTTTEDTGRSLNVDDGAPSEAQEGEAAHSKRVAVGEEEMSFEAMVTYLNRIEVAAAGRNMLSPKSRDALAKLKAGDFRLSATDLNALENLRKNLSRISVRFDLPRKIEPVSEATGVRAMDPNTVRHNESSGYFQNDIAQRPGLSWKQVFLPEGTSVSMRYGGAVHYAEISGGAVVDDDGAFTPSEWATKVANNTSRNAWRDLWLRMPGEVQWVLADELRSNSSE